MIRRAVAGKVRLRGLAPASTVKRKGKKSGRLGMTSAGLALARQKAQQGGVRENVMAFVREECCQE